MAVTYGFYDSLNHDRLYNAQQMSAIFDGIINDGVFMSVGNQLHTVAGTGMQVIVKSGRAWFDSTWTLNDAEYPLSIDAADVLLTRIDAVVLEVNSEVTTRANTIKVVKGTPASTPAKPTLTKTATIHQHALAYVTVAKNITAITNSMIEIVVGKTETPYVTAILQTTDITDLYNQWEDYFQTWFDTVRGTLDGDVALNLQNQITSLRRETLKNTTPPIIGLPASATPADMFQALAKTGDLHVWRKTTVTPAGTTITYPVSTLPNAYQEGSNAKPAGYTLGEVVTSKVKLGYSRLSSGMFYYYADTLSVSDDGKVSISTQNSYQVNRNSTTSDLKAAMAGKFLQLYGSSGSTIELSGPFSTIPGEIVFIPADTSFNTETIRGDDYFTIDRYQPVTGYAAIPAGTTIEYLGKLGDKARVQVVSYVGTGTYGSSNPNSLTFDFVPKILFVVGDYYSSSPGFLFATVQASYIHSPYSSQGRRPIFTFWNKTVKWYYNEDSESQLNASGNVYDAIAIG